ncbi:Cytoplasmic tRNA 2-thiolation protein isoform 1 [Schistosoma japonicum]|uniref:Cytoplasmic tRNA 2-thiolation protein 1 n=2 Tax=Schistosoma japonicum TaxID=6182 RepID=A0A4Z2CYM6_SCHJA|nr:Cytoplasmic tRNA 2-thiolation protein isoform 1 [Schistosoma japonicum]
MPILCYRCQSKGYIKRPKTGHIMCKECFSWCFEEEIHWTIVHAKLITRGDKIAIGASGGKDSTVLAYILNLLNKRYDYGAELLLLSIDEGISGYRDDSLMTVKRNQIQYALPLKILSYQELYGWSMDDIVKRIGNKRNCTYCGIFRRQALDKGALLLGANKICTGHNADDIAETVLMNILRGDIGRLKRCAAIMTGTDDILPRFKPFKYAYEKEIVMYAHMHKLDYFSTECRYAPQAYRGHVRSFIKELERIRPRTIIDIIASGERMAIRGDVKMPQKNACRKCGCISSQPICQACILLTQLNSGLPQITIKDTDHHSEVN